MPLDDYQVACLRQALTRDENGNFPYSLVLWSDVKKSAKSTVAAAVALWLAWQTEWGSIKIVANDLKQADSRVAYYIRRAVELNPYMSQVVNIKPSGYRVELPNHCVIEAIPVDPKGEAGGNDDAVFYSELWAAQNKAAQRLWTESTLSPTKFGKSFRWVETYAGYSGEAPLLEKLYQEGVKEGRQFDWAGDFDPELEVYENKPARMFTLWNTVPRRPWHTSDYHAQESAVLTPVEFQRVHRNQWVSSVNVFVPAEWWHACRDNNIPILVHDQPMIMGVDAAVSGDCFAVVLVAGRGDGLNYDIRYARAWKPPKGGKIDFTEPESEIRRLIEEYNILEMAYDEFQLADLANRLKQEMLVHLRVFRQGAPRARADKQFYDMIRERRIHHDGEHDLSEHVINANAQTDGDNRLRIIKRSQELKIDLAVASSMALDRAVFWQL